MGYCDYVKFVFYFKHATLKWMYHEVNKQQMKKNRKSTKDKWAKTKSQNYTY